MEKILLIEPFYGGSHKVLMDTLYGELRARTSCDLVTMSGKKWHWRARTGALHLSQVLERNQYTELASLVRAGEEISEGRAMATVRFALRSHSPAIRNFLPGSYEPSELSWSIFASSVLNLAEFIGLRPDLAGARKILYFHENQLVYPVQKHQKRDFQYGYNQILSCLVADVILFNSQYNMDSFLSRIDGFLKLMPDFRPKNLAEKLRHKCLVLSFPVTFPALPTDQTKSSPLHILWAHRWAIIESFALREHDKNPEKFFRVIYEMESLGLDYRISVLGETYKDVPSVFEEAKERIPPHKIVQWGWVESKDEYFRILGSAHVAVSTTNHEFFGVGMVEAVYCGAFPLCPKDLVYPEIFPQQCLYATEKQLLKKLKRFCADPWRAISEREELNVGLSQYSWQKLKPKYLSLFLND